jgi:hypothetical protein
VTAPLLLGLTCGLGLWVAAAALRPRPVPLAQAVANLQRPATAPAPPTAGPVVSRVLGLLTTLGIRTPQHDQQLALAGITPHVWARDKLAGTAAGLAVPLAVWAALTGLGIRVPAATGLVALAGAAAGFFLPDLRRREQVAQRRKAFQYALSAYLDLVNVILAGGGGIETALVAAAEAGDGWAFAKLRHALHRAQRINQPLWTAFDELGAELGVAELRELAASIGLAGAQGARIRASLAVKADTLRSHQIAETEAAAEAITGINTTTCLPGDPDCPTPVTAIR